MLNRRSSPKRPISVTRRVVRRRTSGMLALRRHPPQRSLDPQPIMDPPIERPSEVIDLTLELGFRDLPGPVADPAS